MHYGENSNNAYELVSKEDHPLIVLIIVMILHLTSAAATYIEIQLFKENSS